MLLEGYLGQRGHRVVVRYAMRYGTPSIAGVLDAVKAAGADKVLVLPLYPQYAASTTASIGDALAAWMRRVRNLPEIRFVKHYHDDPGYIDALAAARQRALARQRPARQARAQLPRPAAALAHARRSVPLRMPEDRAARRRAAEGARRFRRRHLPEPLRQGRVAAALHRADAGRACAGRRRPGRRLLPRLHFRLPGDARGDRPGGAGRVHRRRRQAVRLHPVPQRPARMARGAGRNRRSATSRAGTPRPPPTRPAKRSRSSAGAPSRPGRQPDPRSLHPGAPIALGVRPIAGTVSARDSRHLAATPERFIPEAQRERHETTQEHSRRRGADARRRPRPSPRFPPAIRRLTPTRSPPPRRRARSSSTARPTPRRPTS